MDLSQLSTEDLIALKSGDLSKVSTDGLVKLKGSINQKVKPEGGNIERFAKGALEGIGQAGVGMMQAATELVAPTPMFGVSPATGTMSSIADPTKKLLTQTVDSSQRRVDNMGSSGALGSLTGNIIGALPEALATPGGAATRLGKIGLDALSGAAGGAVQPVGTNDSRLDNVAGGTALGGVLRTGVEGAKLAKAGTSTALDVGKRVLTGRDADTLLQDILQKSDKTPQQLLDAVTQGKISTIADVAGDDVQGLTRSVAKTAQGKNIISNAFEDRSQGAVQRVSQHLNDNISTVDNYFGNLEDVAKKRAEASAPLYKQAYQEATEIHSPELDKYLNDTRVVNAQNEARKSYGVPLESKPNSLESLDGVKKVLDDQISSAMQTGQKNLAGSLLQLKNGMVNVLDKASPAYAEARKVFGGMSQMQDAQKLGVGFDKLTPEQLRMTFKELSPPEQDAFRIGVRENLQNTVNKTSDGSDPAQRIFGNTQKRSQLQEVLSPDEFKSFESKINEERNAARTKFRVLGGSRTDYNQAADNNEFSSMFEDVAKKGVKETVLTRALDYMKNRYLGINEENSSKIANALINREAGIRALQDIIAKNKGTSTAQAAQDAVEAIGEYGIPQPNKPMRIDIIRRRPTLP